MKSILSPFLILTIAFQSFAFQSLFPINSFKEYQKPAAAIAGITCIGSSAMWHKLHKQAQEIEAQLKGELVPENVAELAKKLEEVQKKQKRAKWTAIGSGALTLLLSAKNCLSNEPKQGDKPDDTSDNNSKPVVQQQLVQQTHRHPFINNILYDDDFTHLKGIKKENEKILVAIPIEDDFELKDYEKEFEGLFALFRCLNQNETEIQSVLNNKKDDPELKAILEKFGIWFLNYLNGIFKQKSPYKNEPNYDLRPDQYDISDPTFYLAKLDKWISDSFPETPNWFYEHQTRLWTLYFEFLKEKDLHVRANKALTITHLLKSEILFALNRAQIFLLKNDARRLEEELGVRRNLHSKKLELFYEDQTLFPISLKSSCIKLIVRELSTSKNFSTSTNDIPLLFDQIPSDIIVQIVYQLLISPHLMPVEQIKQIIDGLKQKWSNNSKYSKDLEQIIEYEQWLLERCIYFQLPMKERPN